MTANLHSFVAGATLQPDSDRELRLIDPASGAETARYLSAGADAVDAAVRAARAVQPGWARMPPMARAAIMRRLAGLIAANGAALAECDRIDMGKPRAAGEFETGIAAGFIQYYAEAIDKAPAGRVAPADHGAMELQLRRPRGVIAAIIPWNFPLINLCMEIAPMLASGNGVVVKPSEISPRSALQVARLAVEAGLPEGLLNVLPGDGITGDLLARHGGIDQIAFTGSTATGLKLMQSVGPSSLKPLQLECGGKSPEFVCADMADDDLDRIAQFILQGSMANQGQLCVARTRLYVQKPLYAALRDRLAEGARHLKAGDPADPATRFGPLASARQAAAVRSFIDTAEANGSELLVDGRDVPARGDGSYVEPTIIAEERQDQKIVQEEIFGPVLTVSSFDSDADIPRLANATPYGLAATVWTKDIGRAHRLAQDIEVGMMKIMSAPVQRMGAGFARAAEPARQSGYGIEGGMAALETFTRLQAVEFHFGGVGE